MSGNSTFWGFKSSAASAHSALASTRNFARGLNCASRHWSGWKVGQEGRYSCSKTFPLAFFQLVWNIAWAKKPYNKGEFIKVTLLKSCLPKTTNYNGWHQTSSRGPVSVAFLCFVVLLCSLSLAGWPFCTSFPGYCYTCSELLSNRFYSPLLSVHQCLIVVCAL